MKIWGAVAAALSPLKPATPVPAKNVIVPSEVILYTALLLLSAT